MNALTINPAEVYQAGYTAFDQGNFPKARLLASQCLAAAAQDSFWHSGALGLKCWSANYLGDNITVEREARRLLSSDAGADKLGFDGLALFNLGLVSRRTRRASEARTYFSQASQRYASCDNVSGQAGGGSWIHRFFSAVARWASTGDAQRLWVLARELANHSLFNPELHNLRSAVHLYLRRAMGEDVAAEAEAAARQGVSRAWLAYILLEKRLPPSTPIAG